MYHDSPMVWDSIKKSVLRVNTNFQKKYGLAIIAGEVNDTAHLGVGTVNLL